ncbi:MAG: family 20 glycosylhydrolase, partial [Bacteroidales bacterium]|nr:family 20 glycosylhydrolase [Bacteroidales bacterium]
GNGAGLFYGVQTLRQLISDEQAPSLPNVKIEDRPRFAYRGFMLDVGRYFFSVDYLKRYFDMMAHYKLNVFHWHLTEDCGWRIEIKKYPELTRKAAWRSSTQITYEGGSNRIPHGGYYTQEQVKDLIRYAAERHITIMPEIEMPGHTLAALSVFPELSCTGGPFAVPLLWEHGTWQLEDDIFCAGNDDTFTFLENVLTEMIDLFPSPYIHIGGDEAPKAKWKACPKCQARIKAEGLKDEDELQSYFVRRIEKLISSKGRQLVGWDEILQGGLAPNAVVMSWRGEEGGIEAARKGHHAIMAPHQYMYLDYYQSKDRPNEPAALGGFLPLEMVYHYEPYTPQLTAEQHAFITGVQTCIWMEFVHSEAHLEYMTFPRAMAVAEIAWSPAEKKNYPHFLERMPAHLAVLDKTGWLFRIPEPTGWEQMQPDNGKIILAWQPPVNGAKICYTTDGTDPSASGKEYGETVAVPLPEDGLLLKCVVTLPSGRSSGIYTKKIENTIE